MTVFPLRRPWTSQEIDLPSPSNQICMQKNKQKTKPKAYYYLVTEYMYRWGKGLSSTCPLNSDELSQGDSQSLGIDLRQVGIISKYPHHYFNRVIQQDYTTLTGLYNYMILWFSMSLIL